MCIRQQAGREPLGLKQNRLSEVINLSFLWMRSSLV